MKKIEKIGLAVCMAMSIGVANVAQADAVGDSMILFPANTSTIDGASTEVYFTKDNTAVGYSLTMVNIGDGSAAALNTASCNAGMVITLAELAADDDSSILKNEIIMADALSCDSDSQLSLADAGLTTDPNATGIAVKMCKYTTDLLAPGDYAIAINPIHLGDGVASAPEFITAAASCSDDNDAHTDNNNAVPYVLANATDTQFQTFRVPADATVMSQAPDAPVVIGPVGELAAGPVSLTFDDISPNEGQATWYKVYIEAPDGSRVTVGGDNWYKLLVDSELVCGANEFTATGQKRSCTITLTLDDVTTGATATFGADEMYKWWVRGYNGDVGGATGPWSATGLYENKLDD